MGYYGNMMEYQGHIEVKLSNNMQTQLYQTFCPYYL